MIKYLLVLSLALNVLLYMVADSQAEDTVGYNYAIAYLVDDLISARTMTSVTIDLMDGYKHANHQLLQHCEPKSYIKAIKATDLPPLVRG